MKLFAAVLVTLLISGCTWVKLTEDGQGVQVLDSSAAASCKALGKITAISKARVAGINRNQKKLATELETIARNEAVDMGGNAVAPLAEIDGNERVFRVYQCE